MNKKQLIETLAARTGQSMAITESMVNAVLDVASATLAAEGEFVMHGLGKLKVRHRASRQVRNPRTGETLTVPPKKTVSFVAAKRLSENLNQSDAGLVSVLNMAVI